MFIPFFPPTETHSFKKIEFQPAEPKKFFSTVRKEMALLATSLPDGIMVKTFEDRMVSSQHLRVLTRRHPQHAALTRFLLEVAALT